MNVCVIRTHNISVLWTILSIPVCYQYQLPMFCHLQWPSNSVNFIKTMWYTLSFHAAGPTVWNPLLLIFGILFASYRIVWIWTQNGIPPPSVICDMASSMFMAIEAAVAVKLKYVSELSNCALTRCLFFAGLMKRPSGLIAILPQLAMHGPLSHSYSRIHSISSSSYCTMKVHYFHTGSLQIWMVRIAHIHNIHSVFH